MEDNENTFLRYLNSLGEKPNSTLRFFDRQDFYTVYNDDAELLAKNYFKSLEVVKFFKKGSVPYININKSNSDVIFRYLLINNQYRVELYSSSGKHDRDNNWSLAYTASPGNLERFQEVLFSNIEVTSTNTLLSLNLKKVSDNYKIFLGFCDVDNGIFMLGSFDESYNGIDQLTNLTSALFQLNCRECLVPAKDMRPEMVALKSTVERSGLLLTEVKKQQYSTENVEEMITKLVCKSRNSVSKITEMEGEDCLGCLGSAVSYLGLMSDDTFYNFFDVHAFKLDNFMRIGEQCSRALNILPSVNDIGKRDSLYGVLNSCRTGLGEKLLMQWMKQPLLDVNLINNRLDIVESLVADNTLRHTLYENHLRQIPDLQRITKRMQRHNSNLQDLYKLYMTLNLAKAILALLYDHQGVAKHAIRSEFCVDLEAIKTATDNFCQMVESTVDLEAVQKHDYKIRADVDDNLAECQNRLNELEAEISEEFTKVVNRVVDRQVAQKKLIKLEVTSNIGYHMRISRKEEKILRNKNNIIVIETLKDGVKFHSGRMQSLNESYLQYRADYETYQQSIIDEIMKISGGYVSPLHKLGAIFAKLDVFCSLAITVVSAPEKYVRPKFVDSDTKRLYLKSCRHPLVEMQPNVSFIANDVQFDENQTFQIITGPNMGGKSTYIRSVGLTVVLAQIGSFVPCEEAELSVSDRVMTRIGAGDCQLKGVSTFMAEMLDVSWILKTATSRSLIIIDELGRGTSTFDGFGLAWSISEYLVTELTSFTLFATHFHELTELARQHSAVCNVHVSAETVDDSLVFLYKVKEGPSMKSYGIEVGKVAGLPAEALDFARLKLKEYEGVVEWKLRGVDLYEQKLGAIRELIHEFCALDVDDGDVASIVYKLRQAMMGV